MVTRQWQLLAKAQDTQDTRVFVDRLTADLAQSHLAQLGTPLLARLRPSVFFGVTTFPPALRARFSYNMSYLISWIFAMDWLLDGCNHLSIAHDFQLLIKRRTELPIDAPLYWGDLQLATNPCQLLPALPYSMYTLVEALQPLRTAVRSSAVDPDGPVMFDRYLTDMIVPAMLREAEWRLGEALLPDFASYMDTAYVSICGGLCIHLINAVLPNPARNWCEVELAVAGMRRVTRLINDESTRYDDGNSGKPNAVKLLTLEMGDERAARLRIRAMINSYAKEVEHFCLPIIAASDPSDPLYVLSYYTYYCMGITDIMYAHDEDFIEPSRDYS